MGNEPIKNTVCLDFDGVIHRYISPWQGPSVIPDPPVEGAQEWCRIALEYWRLAIWSTRSVDPAGRAAMADYLKRWNFPEGIEVPASMPPYFIRIDDRVWLFRGKFPSMQELLEFKPWNRE